MTEYNPKALDEKKPDYQGDSFASWMEKTIITTIELGDLNNLNPILLDALKAAADAQPQEDKKQEELNVVAAINETVSETRRVLVRAIAMS